MSYTDSTKPKETRDWLWSRAKTMIWAGAGIVAAFWLTYWMQLFVQQLTSTSNIEYVIDRAKVSEYLPQNLASLSSVTIGGTDISRGEIITVKFWNRTSTNFDRLNIRPRVKDGAPSPVHKVLLYSDLMEKDWIDWAEVKNLANLEFSVAFMNRNWTDSPNVTVRYFYAGEAPAEFVFKTNRPGIEFVPFDRSKTHWWLFGFDTLAYVTAFLAPYVLMVIVLFKVADKFTWRLYEAFARMLAKNLVANFPDAKKEDLYRIHWLSTRLFFLFQKRGAIWKEKHDIIIQIPPDVGSNSPSESERPAEKAEPSSNSR